MEGIAARMKGIYTPKNDLIRVDQALTMDKMTIKGQYDQYGL